jgi:hypothetical protein
MRFTGCPLGLLMNFGAGTMREGIRRIVNNFPEGTRGASEPIEVGRVFSALLAFSAPSAR